MTPRVRALFALAAAFSLAPCALAQMSPQETVDSFKLADGLEATVWAAEPNMVNPTNMDIDEKGRVWLLEGANYRGSKTRPEGDRILVIEDTDADGKADRFTTFAQDPTLFSPLGVCKLGNKLYVSQSPNVLVYTIDDSGPVPKAVGEPKVLFSGFGGVNHDHGVHALVFGADGRIYFNCGNDGGGEFVKDGSGKPLVDITDSQVGGKSLIYRGKPKNRDNLGYRQGLSFRMNPDGTAFTVMGYNFRNIYELCVDSFGTVWQSDNDDDGNEGVRINYVMEGGNFGFTGPHGSNWQRDMESVPGQTRQEAHWHQRWPGVVPNMLHTGGGSPTGIIVYEGQTLPKPLQGALIHADAGPNVIRAYTPHPSGKTSSGIMGKSEPAGPEKGAGYTADYMDIVNAGDSWFRPSDVDIAPDGTLLIADWYDPGVGGHATGDRPPQLRGRIYRIAPKGFKAGPPKLDLSSVPGQVAALESPNLATRYLAFSKLAAGGASTLAELNNVWKNSDNPRHRARAFWLLVRTERGTDYVREALKDDNQDIRVTAVRAARQVGMDMSLLAKQLAPDADPFVLRELALAMRYVPDGMALPALVALADRYDGKDRWYLEAIGIGATGREKLLLDLWRQQGQNKDPNVAKELAWRLDNEKPAGSPAAAEAPVPPPLDTARSSADAAPAPVFLTKDQQPLPPIAALVKMSGDTKAGEAVFKNDKGANCVSCHQIGDTGRMLGPPLTTIGQKLSKEQLYQSILFPSTAILMGYENWMVRTKHGDVYAGLKVEDTPDHLTIKDTKGDYHDIALEDVGKTVKQSVSIMPEGLAATMSQADLVNLVEYLSTLRNPL